MQIKTNENKKRAILFSENKTFTFIKEVLPDGEIRVHNGFIVEVKDDLIVFFDVTIKREFPVYLDKCSLDVSAKEGMTQNMAQEIYYQHYKNKKEGKI